MNFWNLIEQAKKIQNRMMEADMMYSQLQQKQHSQSHNQFLNTEMHEKIMSKSQTDQQLFESREIQQIKPIRSNEIIQKQSPISKSVENDSNEQIEIQALGNVITADCSIQFNQLIKVIQTQLNRSLTSEGVEKIFTILSNAKQISSEKAKNSNNDSLQDITFTSSPARAHFQKPCLKKIRPEAAKQKDKQNQRKYQQIHNNRKRGPLRQSNGVTYKYKIQKIS